MKKILLMVFYCEYCLFSSGHWNIQSQSTLYIINGPFGDIRSKIIGSDWTSKSFYTQLGLPLGVTVLANRFNTNTPLMYKHSLDFVYMGDFGWLEGSTTDTRNTIFPIGMNASGINLG